MNKETKVQIANLVKSAAELIQDLQNEIIRLQKQAATQPNVQERIKLEKVASIPTNVTSGVVNLLATTVGFDSNEVKEACEQINKNPDLLLELVKSAFETKEVLLSEGYGTTNTTNPYKAARDPDGWL